MSKKRIAILGCSHSSYEQVMNTPGNKDWVHMLADLYPDVHFDNYANLGRGALYYDFVLKYIITNYPKDYYDAVIIQFTVENRWLIGLEQINTRQNETDGFKVTYKPSENYTTYAMSHPHVVTTTPSILIYEENNRYICPTEKTKYENFRESMRTYYGKTDTMVMFYERMFVSTLETLYKDKFKNIFYWDFMNGYSPIDNPEFHNVNRSNISTGKPYVLWATEKFGDVYTVMELLDDTFHCSPEGNRVLLNEYLLSTEIKPYLDELSK